MIGASGRLAIVSLVALTACAGTARVATDDAASLPAAVAGTLPTTRDTTLEAVAPSPSTSDETVATAPSDTNSSTVPAATVPAATSPTSTSPASTVPAPTVPAPTVPVRSGANVNDTFATVGDPISISVPSIGVDSVMVPVGVLADGTVDVPIDPTIAGWFQPGPRPGERGPAVIMGHVDSRAVGPGVFYRLRDLAVGATVTITTTTGPIDFVVTALEQYPKDEFPTDRVYGPVPVRALRLITCGGSFDRSIRHYRDNIVAYLVAVDGG